MNPNARNNGSEYVLLIVEYSEFRWLLDNLEQR